MNSENKIKIVEVGPRDGLQNETINIPTDVKFRFVKNLVDSGLTDIEVSSFVHPEKVPQLRDAEELVNLINESQLKGDFSILVPNLKGLDRAINSNVRKLAVFTSSSETFNKKNINCTIEESLKNIEYVIKKSSDEGIEVRGYVSTAFGCPYEGKTKKNEDVVLAVCEKLIEYGVKEISIGDTIGVATPTQVKSLVGRLKSLDNLSRFAMHFHDTYARALSNVVISYQEGVRIFDTSSGGLGGCPYAKGASGNLATEDLVFLFEDMGVSTGVDLKKLIKSSEEIFKCLNKKPDSKVNLALRKIYEQS